MKIGLLDRNSDIELQEGYKNILNEKLYVFADPLPDGYIDITSVPKIIEVGYLLGKDYKWIRSRMKEIAVDFDTLSDSDKKIICQFKAKDEATCKAILGNDFILSMDIFDKNSQNCRKD